MAVVWRYTLDTKHSRIDIVGKSQERTMYNMQNSLVLEVISQNYKHFRATIPIVQRCLIKDMEQLFAALATRTFLAAMKGSNRLSSIISL